MERRYDLEGTEKTYSKHLVRNQSRLAPQFNFCFSPDLKRPSSIKKPPSPTTNCRRRKRKFECEILLRRTRNCSKNSVCYGGMMIQKNTCWRTVNSPANRRPIISSSGALIWKWKRKVRICGCLYLHAFANSNQFTLLIRCYFGLQPALWSMSHINAFACSTF